MKKQILLTAMLLITTTTACAQFNIKIGSGKTVQKKLSKLSRHKKYYVQVRAVKTRKNADGKTVTYRGAWSGKKSISTK